MKKEAIILIIIYIIFVFGLNFYNYYYSSPAKPKYQEGEILIPAVHEGKKSKYPPVIIIQNIDVPPDSDTLAKQIKAAAEIQAAGAEAHGEELPKSSEKIEDPKPASSYNIANLITPGQLLAAAQLGIAIL